MEERRRIDRVEYVSESVIVICDTQEKLQARVENISPLGMGVVVGAQSPDILHKDIIIVTDTLIMYAEVNRREKREDGTYFLGIGARKFTPDVMEFLFESIGAAEEEK